MSLLDAMNSRAGGTVDETYVYTEDARPQIHVPAEPVPATEVKREKQEVDYGTEIVIHVGKDGKSPPDYTDDTFIAALKRMQKAVPFMLSNLYTPAGADQLENFVGLVADVQNLATLRMVSVALDGA